MILFYQSFYTWSSQKLPEGCINLKDVHNLYCKWWVRCLKEYLCLSRCTHPRRTIVNCDEHQLEGVVCSHQKRWLGVVSLKFCWGYRPQILRVLWFNMLSSFLFDVKSSRDTSGIVSVGYIRIEILEKFQQHVHNQWLHGVTYKILNSNSNSILIMRICFRISIIVVHVL